MTESSRASWLASRSPTPARGRYPRSFTTILGSSSSLPLPKALSYRESCRSEAVGRPPQADIHDPSTPHLVRSQFLALQWRHVVLRADVRQVQIIPGRATERHTEPAAEEPARQTSLPGTLPPGCRPASRKASTIGDTEPAKVPNHQRDKNLCWDSNRMLQPARSFIIASALLPTALAICLPTRNDALDVGVLECCL